MLQIRLIYLIKTWMNKAKLIVRKVTFGWSHQKRCQAQQRELHFILIRVGTLHSIKNRYAAELCPKVLAISMVKLNVARHKKNALKSDWSVGLFLLHQKDLFMSKWICSQFERCRQSKWFGLMNCGPFIGTEWGSFKVAEIGWSTCNLF